MRRDDDPDVLFDRRLSEDAARDMPTFSAALHARVMRRVEGASRAMPRRRSTLRLWVERVSFAAAAVVAVSVVGWLFNSRAGRISQPQPADLPMMASLNPLDVVAESTREVGAKLDDARFGYLDHDVRTFASFIRETVPSAPIARGG